MIEFGRWRGVRTVSLVPTVGTLEGERELLESREGASQDRRIPGLAERAAGAEEERAGVPRPPEYLWGGSFSAASKQGRGWKSW